MTRSTAKMQNSEMPNIIKISDFYRVLYRTLCGRCVHRLGDAKPVNRGASYPSRGLSRIRGRSLDDPEIETATRRSFFFVQVISRECPLLAQSGHRLVHCTCPLSGGRADANDVTAPESVAKLWHKIIVDTDREVRCCQGAVKRNRRERWLS